MKTIFFPARYKKAIVYGKKNTTIRVEAEIGKYKERKIYDAKSYAGKEWNVKIKINKIISTIFSELSKYDIPRRSIGSIAQKHNLKAKDRVEIIRFEIASSLLAMT